MMMKRIVQIIHNLIGKRGVSDVDAGKGRIDSEMSADKPLPAAAESPETVVTQDTNLSLKMLDGKTFDKVVGESLSGGRKTGCLLICDVDRCKEINDIYGRDIGDGVLRYVEDVLRGVFGDSTCIGSPGGDVFKLWFPVMSGQHADDVRRQIGIVNDRLLHPARELPPVSISAGAAFCRTDDDCKSIHKRANQELYRVKVGGRCGCEISV